MLREVRAAWRSSVTTENGVSGSRERRVVDREFLSRRVMCAGVGFSVREGISEVDMARLYEVSRGA